MAYLGIVTQLSLMDTIPFPDIMELTNFIVK